MLLRLSRLAVVLALACALGFHWFMLQSVAWVTMFSRNLPGNSLALAVQRTFDGKHPCAICLLIAKAKSAEKKAQFPAPIQKLEFVSPKAAFAFFPPTRFQLLEPADAGAESLAFPPPTPPPRAASS